MSTIVYCTDKKTGNKFAYETYSVKDSTSGKAVTKKKYLGRVDPETGEIIPKAESGKRNRKLSTLAMEQASRKDHNEIDTLKARIIALRDRISQLEQEIMNKDQFINTILEASHQYETVAFNARQKEE